MKSQEQISCSYRAFCKTEGNLHIASEYAVLKLQEMVERLEVKSILEVGLGIGAIAGSLLAVNHDLFYTGTENNEFCQEALKKNLGNDYKRLQLFPGIHDLDKTEQFDLIVIDGKDLGLKKLSRHLTSKGIIAIEGDRKEQQAELQGIFPKHLFVHCISKNKNKAYSPFSSNHWQGGIKIIFVNPDLKQKYWWAREKAKTKLKYLLRAK